MWSAALNLISSSKFNWSYLARSQSVSAIRCSKATLNEPISIWTGRTAFMPYTNEKGVVPVDVQNDVRYAHNAKWSFSDQSRDVLTIFHRILLIFLFAVSTTPLVYGLYVDDRWCQIPYSGTSVSTSPLKCTPLFEINSWGILYRQIICDLMNLATLATVNLA